MKIVAPEKRSLVDGRLLTGAMNKFRNSDHRPTAVGPAFGKSQGGSFVAEPGDKAGRVHYAISERCHTDTPSIYSYTNIPQGWRWQLFRGGNASNSRSPLAVTTSEARGNGVVTREVTPVKSTLLPPLPLSSLNKEEECIYTWWVEVQKGG